MPTSDFYQGKKRIEHGTRNSGGARFVVGVGADDLDVEMLGEGTKKLLELLWSLKDEPFEKMALANEKHPYAFSACTASVAHSFRPSSGLASRQNSSDRHSRKASSSAACHTQNSHPGLLLTIYLLSADLEGLLLRRLPHPAPEPDTQPLTLDHAHCSHLTPARCLVLTGVPRAEG